MRGDVGLACGLLFAALLACGDRPRAVSWRPSSSVSREPLVSRAVVIDANDVEAVHEAGGVSLGTLVYKDGEFTIDTITDYASREAAEYGGTHVALGSYKEASGPTSYTAHKTFGDSYVVVPHERKTKHVSYLVLRVPQTAWSNLPKSLKPES